jgi:hypothetical protein
MKANLILRVALFFGIVIAANLYGPIYKANQEKARHPQPTLAWDLNSIDHAGNVYRVDYALTKEDCLTEMFGIIHDGDAHECVRHQTLDLD